MLADKWLGRAQISLAASEAPGHRVQSSLKGNHFAGHALFGQLLLFLFVHTWHHNPGILAVPELEFQKCKKCIEVDPCVCEEGGGVGGASTDERSRACYLLGGGGRGGGLGDECLCALCRKGKNTCLLGAPPTPPLFHRRAAQGMLSVGRGGGVAKALTDKKTPKNIFFLADPNYSF